jgi:hypothetical protein
MPMHHGFHHALFFVEPLFKNAITTSYSGGKTNVLQTQPSPDI